MILTGISSEALRKKVGKKDGPSPRAASDGPSKRRVTKIKALSLRNRELRPVHQ